MKKMKQIIASVVLTVLACSANAFDVFTNQTIGYKYYYPDLSSPERSGSYLVGVAGVTIPDVPNLGLSLFIQGNNITQNLGNYYSQYASASFNGFKITDPNVQFTSFSLVSNTALSGNPILTYDSHNLYVNLQGLNISSGTVQYAVTAVPVPEPETYPMMLSGIGLLGFIAARRKKSA